VILGPTIQKLVDADYDRTSNRFTLFESVSQQVADLKIIVSGLQQGIADDVALHRAPSSPATATPSAASSNKVKVTAHAVSKAKAGVKKVSQGAHSNVSTGKKASAGKGAAHSARHHKVA
jgi:hypothetical protein